MTATETSGLAAMLSTAAAVPAPATSGVDFLAALTSALDTPSPRARVSEPPAVPENLAAAGAAPGAGTPTAVVSPPGPVEAEAPTAVAAALAADAVLPAVPSVVPAGVPAAGPLAVPAAGEAPIVQPAQRLTPMARLRAGTPRQEAALPVALVAADATASAPTAAVTASPRPAARRATSAAPVAPVAADPMDPAVAVVPATAAPIGAVPADAAPAVAAPVAASPHAAGSTVLQDSVVLPEAIVVAATKVAARPVTSRRSVSTPATEGDVAAPGATAVDRPVPGHRLDAGQQPAPTTGAPQAAAEAAPAGLGMVGSDRVTKAREQLAARPVQRLSIELDDARVALRVRGDKVTVDVTSDPKGTLGDGWARQVERTIDRAVRAQDPETRGSTPERQPGSQGRRQPSGQPGQSQSRRQHGPARHFEIGEWHFAPTEEAS